MAESYKVLGQDVSVPLTDTTIYTVSSLKQAAVSCIIVTNASGSDGDYTLSIVPSADAGSATQSKHKIVSGKQIKTNESHELKGGITLSTGDQIRVYSDALNNVIVNVYGVELS